MNIYTTAYCTVIVFSLISYQVSAKCFGGKISCENYASLPEGSITRFKYGTLDFADQMNKLMYLNQDKIKSIPAEVKKLDKFTSRNGWITKTPILPTDKNYESKKEQFSNLTKNVIDAYSKLVPQNLKRNLQAILNKLEELEKNLNFGNKISSNVQASINKFRNIIRAKMPVTENDKEKPGNGRKEETNEYPLVSVVSLNANPHKPNDHQIKRVPSHVPSKKLESENLETSSEATNLEDTEIIENQKKGESNIMKTDVARTAAATVVDQKDHKESDDDWSTDHKAAAVAAAAVAVDRRVADLNNPILQESYEETDDPEITAFLIEEAIVKKDYGNSPFLLVQKGVNMVSNNFHYYSGYFKIF